MPDPAWTSPAAAAAIAAIASSIAAGLAVYNAWELRKQGEEKLKIDLFERRYRIYEAIYRYIAHMDREGNVSDDAIRELDRGCTAIEFLFDKDVRDYVRTVRNKGIDLMTARKIMEPLPVGDEHSKQSALICELVKWSSQQFESAEHVFSRYLKFPVPGSRI